MIPETGINARGFFSFFSNVHILPPGHGRAVGVDVVGFMPVGSDDLLAVLSPG